MATTAVFKSDLLAQCVPTSVADSLSSIHELEHGETERVGTMLDTAWQHVERVLELNRQRDEVFDGLRTQLSEAFRHVTFWTPESIGEEFNLTPVGLDAMGSNVALPDSDLAEIESPRSVASGTSGRASGKPGLDGTSKASVAAHYAPAAEVMAPIRRCFASILRKRPDAPKEFTLLMRGLEELQHRVVPIEERMSASRFKLPLHIPFQSIAQLVTRTLLPQQTGLDLEQWFTTEIKPKLAELHAAYLALEREQDPSAIYSQLETEAAERKRFHDVCIELIGRAVETEGVMRTTFTEAHRDTTKRCDEALAYVRGQATNVTNSSKALVEEVDAVEARGRAEALSEADTLKAQLKEAEYRVKKSRKAQEVHTRQVREALKALSKEQVAHEVAVRETAELSMRIARLEEAQAQFTASCKERRLLLADAHEACLFVNDVISDITDEVRTGLQLCQQHISRVLSEENFRKIRVATQPMHNAREWYRCVGDLLKIREHRRDHLRERMQGSWQLEFLLRQEEAAHTTVMEEYEAALHHIQVQWAKLTAQLVDLEVHVPVLAQYDKDPTVTRLRQAFLALHGIGKDNDMRAAHKQMLSDEARDVEERRLTLPPVPPLRTSKASSSTRNPATGVRHLPRPPSGSGNEGSLSGSLPSSSADGPRFSTRKAAARQLREGPADGAAPSTPNCPKRSSTVSLPPASKTPR
jgi:hypothetical protein